MFAGEGPHVPVVLKLFTKVRISRSAEFKEIILRKSTFSSAGERGINYEDKDSHIGECSSAFKIKV